MEKLTKKELLDIRMNYFNEIACNILKECKQVADTCSGYSYNLHVYDSDINIADKLIDILNDSTEGINIIGVLNKNGTSYSCIKLIWGDSDCSIQQMANYIITTFNYLKTEKTITIYDVNDTDYRSKISNYIIDIFHDDRYCGRVDCGDGYIKMYRDDVLILTIKGGKSNEEENL